MKLPKKSRSLFALLLVVSLFSACATTPDSATVINDSPAGSSQAAIEATLLQNNDIRLSDEDALPEAERQVLEEVSDSPVPFSAGNGQGTSAASAVPPAGTYTGPIHIKTPSAPDTVSFKKGGSVIDVSNSAEGYFMVSHKGSTKRLKMQVKQGEQIYNYDLVNTGAFEVFPLQLGNGAYTARVMENVSGSTYRELFRADFNVALASANNPYLYPNQYVNYTASSAAVKKSFDLCVNAKTDVDKLKAIYNYMIQTIKYDYDKAATVTTGYLPNVDTVLTSQKGICFDYSALMSAMLRAQGVPTKLVIGSADAVAATHSWNEVYLQGTGWITIKIENTKTGWKLMDPTFGATGSTSSSYTTARIY